MNTTEQTLTIKTAFASVRDAVYQSALARGVTQNAAEYINAKYGATWYKTEDKAHKAEIFDAALIRKAELRPAVWYRAEGDNMVRLDAAPKKDAAEGCFQMSIPFAMSLSTQAINGIKSRPNYKSLIQEWRKDGQKYASDLYNDILRECKRLAEGGETRKRETHATAMSEKIPETFKALRKSNKVARDSRGDDSALSDEAFAAGEAAFWIVAGHPMLLTQLTKIAKTTK